MSGEQEPATEAPTPSGRRPGKSAAAFRTISEVAAELDIPTHVLRFWEGKFPGIRPLKRGGGRRYYRPEDVELLRRIRRLLYEEGYTIKGAQRVVRELGSRDGMPELDLADAAADEDEDPPGKSAGAGPAASRERDPERDSERDLENELTEILDELRVLRGLLSGTER